MQLETSARCPGQCTPTGPRPLSIQVLGKRQSAGAPSRQQVAAWAAGVPAFRPGLGKASHAEAPKRAKLFEALNLTGGGFGPLTEMHSTYTTHTYAQRYAPQHTQLHNCRCRFDFFAAALFTQVRACLYGQGSGERVGKVLRCSCLT